MKLFNKKIDPACGYCTHGKITPDGAFVLCPKKGIMEPSSSCRRFRYAPLKRKPPRKAPLPTYESEEFEL